MIRSRVTRFVLSLLPLTAASPTFAQSPPLSPLGWSGWARCQVTVQGPGYTDQQTHTWTMTGTPTVEGAFRVYPGTWSVVGGGSLQRTQGTQTLTAQWATNVQAMSGPLAVFVRASDSRMLIQARHAQLRGTGAVQGFQQLTIDGKPQTPGQIAAEAFEWAFPSIAVSPPIAPATNATANGSSSPAVSGSVGPMQPAGSQVNASCTWQFGQGSTAPPPPSPLNAQAIPTPPVPGGAIAGGTTPAGTLVGSTVGGRAPAGNAPAGASPAGAVAGGVAPTSPSPGQPPVAPPATVTAPNAPVNSLPTTRPPGGFTTVPAAPVSSSGVTAATARDPSNFVARQTADGTVLLTWNAVPGAGSYMVGGPGTNVGLVVSGTSQTLTGVSPGAQTWTVATMYNPGGVLTTSSQWSKATITVVNRSGRYRIVLNGFRVNQESWDDQLNLDGQHDEVYASAAVTVIDTKSSTALQATQIVKSGVHGDSSKGHVQTRAGSILPAGGIATGDAVPSVQNPALPAGAPSTVSFPLLLWEGTLTDDVEAVAVRPVLWEWDGSSVLYDDWRNYTQGQMNEIASVTAKASAMDLTPYKGRRGTFCGGGVLNLNTCRPGVDRPIGLGTCFATNGQDSWCDQVLVFTRRAIEAALSSPNQAGGIPAGSIHIPLVETAWDTRANYDMYLRFERIP